jgi:poly(A) polymerase
MIMQTFGLKPAKEVGIIKEIVREAILEGTIPNEYEAAFAFMVEEGKKMGFSVQ